MQLLFASDKYLSENSKLPLLEDFDHPELFVAHFTGNIKSVLALWKLIVKDKLI